MLAVAGGIALFYAGMYLLILLGMVLGSMNEHSRPKKPDKREIPPDFDARNFDRLVSELKRQQNDR